MIKLYDYIFDLLLSYSISCTNIKSNKIIIANSYVRFLIILLLLLLFLPINNLKYSKCSSILNYIYTFAIKILAGFSDLSFRFRALLLDLTKRV